MPSAQFNHQENLPKANWGAPGLDEPPGGIKPPQMIWQRKVGALFMRWNAILLGWSWDLLRQPENIPSMPRRTAYLFSLPIRFVLSLLALMLDLSLVFGLILLWLFGTIFCVPYYLLRLVVREAMPSGGVAGPYRKLLFTARLIFVIAKLPFYVIGLALGALMFIMVVVLWPLPDRAQEQELKIYDVLVRALEEEQDRQMLFPFPRIEPELEEVQLMIPDTDPTRPPEWPSRIDRKWKGPHQHEYRVFFPTKPGVTITGTTPYTNISIEQLREARKRLTAFYPEEQPVVWPRLAGWGFEVQRHVKTRQPQSFPKSWALNIMDDRNRMPEPEIGEGIPLRRGRIRVGIDDGAHIYWSALRETPNAQAAEMDDELLWFTWRELCTGGTDVELDLPCLPALLQRAYPDETDRDNALAWARDFLARREHTFHGGNKHTRPDPFAPLPPPTAFTYQWLLYRAVGLTPDSEDVARARSLAGIAPQSHEKALFWGRQLEMERRRAGEPLPPTSDNVALLCLVERLRGTDPYSDHCREFLIEQIPVGDIHFARYVGFLAMSYPNDDLFYLLVLDDPLRLGMPSSWALITVASCVLLVSVTLRALVFVVLGTGILRLGKNPHFREFRRHHRMFAPYNVLLKYLVIPLAAWPFASWSLPIQLQLQIHSPWQTLAGTYLSVVLGGTVLAVMSQLVAIVLLRCGYDLQKTWLDEIIGLSLGAYVLFHFGNDPVSILAFAAFALLPEIVVRRRIQRFRDEASFVRTE